LYGYIRQDENAAVQGESAGIFRLVEQTGGPIIITDRDTPVLKLVPHREVGLEDFPHRDPADRIWQRRRVSVRRW